MTLHLYRHGETRGNLEKRYIGATDQPLCDEGIRHAVGHGENAGISKVYTSSLKRTRQTAALWFPKAEITPLPGLAEMNFGAFEGKRYDELAGDPAYEEWVAGGCEGRCPHGESMTEFVERIGSAIEALPTQRETIIVAHGGTLMAVMSRWARPKRPYFHWHIGHCEGYQIDLETGIWRQRRELP